MNPADDFFTYGDEDPVEEQRKWREQLQQQQTGGACVLSQPMWLVVPPEGMIIHCPIHPKGHFLRPTTVTC